MRIVFAAVITALLMGSTSLSADVHADAMGGPEQSEEALQQEILFRDQFTILAEESSALERERAAVRKAVSIASKRNDWQHRSALEARLREISEIQNEIAQARLQLVALQKDHRRARLFADDSARHIAGLSKHMHAEVQKRIETYQRSGHALEWPIEPARGISAHFHDEGYEKRFGLAHNAIDIPVVQGSNVFAAADGLVAEINDRGYGYNTLVIDHGDDLSTVYGHVSEFKVSQGEEVFQGQQIALSGGRPGSKGAGFLTTGPHLHFEVHVRGQPIDPLYELPPTVVAYSE